MVVRECAALAAVACTCRSWMLPDGCRWLAGFRPLCICGGSVRFERFLDAASLLIASTDGKRLLLRLLGRDGRLLVLELLLLFAAVKDGCGGIDGVSTLEPPALSVCNNGRLIKAMAESER